MLVVVDTNVAVVANEKSEQASSSCIQNCLLQLKRITGEKDRIVIDNQWIIIREYMANLRSSGEPGIGDEFLKWVLTNHTNPKRCSQVRITPVNGVDENFEEFPSDPDLHRFDRSDRKFVAVALSHPKRPTILQAVDSDWWNARDALKRNGVRIKFLCPHDIS